MTKRKDETIPLRDPDPARPAVKPRYSARFYAHLPPAPTLPDRGAAQSYLVEIRRLRATPMAPPWTRSERFTLQRLEKKWARRAAGDDARWNRMGSTPGRAPATEADLRRRPDPAWSTE
jgi:hypothetical protein